MSVACIVQGFVVESKPVNTNININYLVLEGNDS